MLQATARWPAGEKQVFSFADVGSEILLSMSPIRKLRCDSARSGGTHRSCHADGLGAYGTGYQNVGVSVTTIGKPAQLTTASPGRQPCGCVSTVAKCRVSVTTSGKPAQLTLWARRVGRYDISGRRSAPSLRACA